MLLILSSGSFASDISEADIQNIIRNRLETQRFQAADRNLYSRVTLPAFYADRIYRPVWLNPEGSLALARELGEAIADADLHGLTSRDYHYATITDLVRRIEVSRDQDQSLPAVLYADLDLLLTDAFLLLASHYRFGRINPETYDPGWHVSRRKGDMVSVLKSAVSTGEIRQQLESQLPERPEYFRLKERLAELRSLSDDGGWPVVPPGSTLKADDVSQRIPLLRQRLKMAGDLPVGASLELTEFDSVLENAVKKFQIRHGLDVDGIVGTQTLNQLNVPVERRIEQILVNLERWRWLPEDFGNRYIIVNIANFDVRVIEDELTVMEMRAVVGRPYRRTPVFSANMTYLVFSPFWHVPRSLAVRDILPRVRQDPEYLQEQKIRVFQGVGANSLTVAAEDVDWNLVDASNFPYRFRQDPGPNNALGRVKFMFPNQYNVYLHDTPAQELFQRTVRDFSSGCIRVEKPQELAEYLLRDRPEWDRDRIKRAKAADREETVTLRSPIMVYLLYWTAWVDNNLIHFRNDIYGRDADVLRGLRTPHVPS
jgi:L,D-transpeptidase YcbB